MVVLLRSTDGNPDSRFEKYVNFLQSKNINYMSFCWDRLLIKQETAVNKYYRKSANYGDGSGNITKLLGFNCYLLKNLIKYRKAYKVIHACDFDTILPALFMKIFFRKKIIYDIFDWYIDSRGLYNSFIKYFLLLFEFLNLKIADVTIICEEERVAQLSFKPKNLWVLPNIPYFSDFKIISHTHSQLVVSYVGILAPRRGLDRLLDYVISHDAIQLQIAGFGPLEDDFKKAALTHDNITFHGRVLYEDGLRIMSDSDIIYAMYDKINRNNIFAAPNKYYEGLFLGKPIITTRGTLVGDKTERYQTGFAINESYDDLVRCMDSITLNDIHVCSQRAQALWNGTYCNYVSDFLNTKYLTFITASK